MYCLLCGRLQCPCLGHTSTLCRNCLIETGTVVSCLMKCQPERTSISIGSLAVFRVWTTMEQRTCSIANHALVFVFCGLHQKWKRPVAYYFNRGSTKANLLMKFLVHIRLLDCMLLPLSVTWVQTVSRPWKCVLPDRSDSSSLRPKILWLYMILHTNSTDWFLLFGF